MMLSRPRAAHPGPTPGATATLAVGDVVDRADGSQTGGVVRMLNPHSALSALVYWPSRLLTWSDPTALRRR